MHLSVRTNEQVRATRSSGSKRETLSHAKKKTLPVHPSYKCGGVFIAGFRWSLRSSTVFFYLSLFPTRNPFVRCINPAAGCPLSGPFVRWLSRAIWKHLFSWPARRRPFVRQVEPTQSTLSTLNTVHQRGGSPDEVCDSILNLAHLRPTFWLQHLLV